MAGEPYTIRAAGPGDVDRVREILTLADLPQAGVEAAEVLLVVEFDGRVEGCAALEVRGRAALLRSVAVSAARRGSAVGTALVEATLERARRGGIERLYLLTTTAQPFFEGLDFVVTRRSSAPAEIAATDEFRALCPDSAVFMERVLTGEAGPGIS